MVLAKSSLVAHATSYGFTMDRYLRIKDRCPLRVTTTFGGPEAGETGRRRSVTAPLPGNVFQRIETGVRHNGAPAKT